MSLHGERVFWNLSKVGLVTKHIESMNDDRIPSVSGTLGSRAKGRGWEFNVKIHFSHGNPVRSLSSILTLQGAHWQFENYFALMDGTHALSNTGVHSSLLLVCVFSRASPKSGVTFLCLYVLYTLAIGSVGWWPDGMFIWLKANEMRCFNLCLNFSSISKPLNTGIIMLYSITVQHHCPEAINITH